VAVSYQLEPRLLTQEDQPWLDRFAVGEEWWSHEITDFLRNQALEDAQQGLSSTTLFSFPGLKDVIGFITAASASLPSPQLAGVVTLPATFTAARVPAVVIPYLGIARPYRRVGHFGQEIHFRLLEALDAAPWAAVRLLYVECWAANDGGNAFWQKMGYVRFSQIVRDHPETGEPEYLNRLVYDRFAIQP